MRLMLLAVLAAFCLAAAPGARAQTGPETVIVIRVCNNTDAEVRAAVSYQPVGQRVFFNQGWIGVAPGACEDLGATDNAFFYAYAEDVADSRRRWSGDMPLCVTYPGPYAFWTVSDRCEDAQAVRSFVTMQAPQLGVYTWTLAP